MLIFDLQQSLGELVQLFDDGVPTHSLTETSLLNHFQFSLYTCHMYDTYQTLDCNEIKKNHNTGISIRMCVHLLVVA